MSHRRYIKPDVLLLAKLLHLIFRKVRTIICDDAMWKAETENNLFEKLNRRGCITFTDGHQASAHGPFEADAGLLGGGITICVMEHKYHPKPIYGIYTLFPGLWG